MDPNLKLSLHKEIKFGTDGWRGVIGADFTFENIRKVAFAMGQYFKKEKDIIIGYDNRFLADEYAREIAKVISSFNINVVLTKTSVTSPLLSYNIRKRHFSGGVMVTASHNPYYFCGIKIKGKEGCSVGKDVTTKIESQIKKIRDIKKLRFKEERIQYKDFTNSYLSGLKKYFNFDLVKRKKLTVVVDYLYGSSSGYLEKIFQNSRIRIISLHNRKNPLFGGINPEPIEKNLSELKEEVLKQKADIGIGLDGDGDRIGIVDDRGNYYSPHLVFPLILLYLLRGRKEKGTVVQAISLGYLSERIAKRYGLKFVEVPVGFKNIAKYILSKGDVLTGGEESGGFTIKGYLPERDGILISLIFIEMLSLYNKKLFQIKDEMESEFGKSYFLREDITIPKMFFSKESFSLKVKSNIPSKFNKVEIKEIKVYDGVKIIFKNEWWLLLRPSGTEPLIRIYAETESLKKTKKLLELGRTIVYNL